MEKQAFCRFPRSDKDLGQPGNAGWQKFADEEPLPKDKTWAGRGKQERNKDKYCSEGREKMLKRSFLLKADSREKSIKLEKYTFLFRKAERGRKILNPRKNKGHGEK